MRGLAIICFLMCSPLWATTRYLAQSAGTFSGGTACNGQTAITPSTWNSTAESAGDLTYVCGTITGSAGSTILTFGWSGSLGSPITLKFDTGGIVQAPYCPPAGGGSSGACISANGRSYIVIDGNNLTGTVQNSLNGKAGAACPGGACSNQQPTALIDIQACSNCTVKNLNVVNAYIEVQNANSANSTDMIAIQSNGSNQIISGNSIANCGWCVQFFFNNADSNWQAFSNSFHAFGHAFALAPGSGTNVCGSSGVICAAFTGNVIGPAGLNWDASACPNHKDGIHIYDVGGSPVFWEIDIANNFFGGDYGVCPTGYLFTETDFFGSTAHYRLWNNVFAPSGTHFPNSNGWVYLGSMLNSGSITEFYNNTFYDTTNTAGTTCIKQGFGTDTGTLNFRDNVMNGCDTPIAIGGPTVFGTFNTNFYGSGISSYNWKGTNEASFSNWKTACSCDSSSVQNSIPKINLDGSLQSGSPAIGIAANLSSLATGNLATLQNDTTEGQRVSTLRPSGGLWDAGAFQFSAAVVTPAPALGMFADLGIN